MLHHTGYSLVDSSNTEIKFWGNSLYEVISMPERIILPNGDIVEAPTLDGNWSDEYKLIERWIESNPTTEIDEKISETIEYRDGKTIVVYNYQLPNTESMKTLKKAKLASKRWEIETSGAVINGNLYATDRESQVKYTAVAVALFQANPLTWTINWKVGDGTFVVLNAQQMSGVINTVMTHVQTSFNKEAEFIAQIDVCTTVEEILAIDLEQGWPSNEYTIG